MKGVRKSTRYHELLASLQPEPQSSEPIEHVTVGPDQGSLDDIHDDTIHDPSPSQWAAEVRATIKQLGVPDGIPGRCWMQNIPGGCLCWQDLTGGHPDQLGPPGYGLDNQSTQCGRGVGVPTPERSVLSDFQESAARTTSFAVPGRNNLPQYPWPHRSHSGVAYSNTHLSMTIENLHQRGQLSGTWSILSPSRT